MKVLVGHQKMFEEYNFLWESRQTIQRW